MHEYSTCPTHEGDLVLKTQESALSLTDNDEQRDTLDDDQNTACQSTLDLSLRNASERLALPSPPPSTHSDTALAQSQPPSAASTRSEKGTKQTVLNYLSNWKAAWRLQSAIVGLYLLAIHCGLFVYLDDRILSPDIELAAKSTSIPQGYVTTISFLLTKAFRATLVASVGICYTQILWATLRGQTPKVDLIENLFQAQNNVFHLISANLYLKTPLLAALAGFCWLIPLALVYPPGALTIHLQPFELDDSFNVSVMHAKGSSLIDKSLPYISCETSDSSLPAGIRYSDTAYVLESCVAYLSTSFDPSWIARTSLVTGEIARLDPPPKLDSTYSLDFWGTTLTCETTNRTIENVVFKSDTTSQYPELLVPLHKLMFDHEAYRSTYDRDNRRDRYPDIGNAAITLQYADKSQHLYQYYPCQDMRIDPASGSLEVPDIGIQVLISVMETVCQPEFTKYSATISHASGTQQVLVVTDNEEPKPAYTSEFARFNGSFETWVQLTDALAIYRAFEANFNVTGFDMIERLSLTNVSFSTKEPSYKTVNNTEVETCVAQGANTPSIRGMDISLRHPLWAISVFESRRDDPIEPSSLPNFDTEIAKARLINTTISALSLNRNFDTVPGTYTRNFNVYKFSNKLTFFLPYGLALGLCIPIIALGLVAFYTRNQGVSAITGGFLQILMTTTGQGKLEAVIKKGSGTMGGHENVSDELRETEIRFGEFIAEDDGEGKSEHVPPDSRGGASLSSSDSIQRCDDEGDGSGEVVAPVVSKEEGTSDVVRVGFGVLWEVRSLRRRAKAHMQ